jgi:hypothetical protein
VLGIHASHGPDNRTAPLEQTQIVSRPGTPTGASTTLFV